MNFEDRLDELVAESARRVHLRAEGEYATVTFADERSVEVPIGQLHLQAGHLWVQVPGPLIAEYGLDQFHIVHPEPTPLGAATMVGQLDIEELSRRMQYESSVASMDDPLALIAIRAVTAALTGEQAPPEQPESLE